MYLEQQEEILFCILTEIANRRRKATVLFLSVGPIYHYMFTPHYLRPTVWKLPVRVNIPDVLFHG
jgi:hypothetical protein